MNQLKRTPVKINLFKPMSSDAHYWDIMKWWELHRVPYNVVAMFTTFATIFIFEFLAVDMVKPGEDAIEPIAILVLLVVAALGWNLCYFLGPALDALLKNEKGTHGPQLWTVGTIFSVVVLAAPITLFAIAKFCIR